MIGRIKNVYVRRMLIATTFLPVLAIGLVWYGICGAAAFAVTMVEASAEVCRRDYTV